jgi:hypothetical protein
MINKKDEVVWKDSKAIEIARLLIIIIPLILFLIVTKSIYDYLGDFVILFFIYGLIMQLRRRQIYVSSIGIRMGNISQAYEKQIFPKGSFSIVYLWRDISYIHIVRKELKNRAMIITRDFVRLKPKVGLIHECVLYDKEGFIEALNGLKKSYLLNQRPDGLSDNYVCEH